MYFTYVLYSPAFDRIYVGQTNDIKTRVAKHNQGLVRSTKSFVPWNLIYFEKFPTRSEAMQREKQLKSHQGRLWIRTNLLNDRSIGRVRRLPDFESGH